LSSHPQILEESLTTERPSQLYRFCIGQPGSLAWRWQGPAVHLVLQDPQGNASGPGLSNPVPLPLEGCYRLSVSANTMAEGAFGSYSLSLQFSPAQ
jgi:hypothetical protein